jgi:glycosyltransferase involved in cell wall biosynthesis
MIPVSICLTTWNRARQLPITLDSLLGQTFGDFELIISDDCSGDETESVCHEYVLRDRRVKYFRNDVNLNMPGNLNAAIARAKGHYIANLHDGDVYRKDLIEKWKSALDRFPSAAFVFNDYRTLLADGKESIARMPFDALVPGQELARHYFRTVTSCVWGTVMARASAYREFGLFDPSFGFISDVEMWLRLAAKADVAYVAEPLITLGERPKSHPFREGVWRAAFWAFAIYRKHLGTFQSQMPGEVAHYRARYPKALRRYFLRTMAACLRHRKWDRVREGLVIWADSQDVVLRSIGRLLSLGNSGPGWYGSSWWKMARLG